MSSSQLYPHIPAPAPPQSSEEPVYTDSMQSSWFPSYLPYNPPYLTPSSSTFDASTSATTFADPWHGNTGLVPDYDYSILPFPTYEQIEDPRASPPASVYRQDPIWNSNALRISNLEPSDTLNIGCPVVTTAAPIVPAALPLQQQQLALRERSLTEGQAPTTPSPPRHPRSYPPLAPDPVSLAAKRRREEEEEEEEEQATASSDKRRRRTPSAAEALHEDDRLLLKLKEEDQLSWKDIVSQFIVRRGQTHTVAALQMRYGRLRARLRVWQPEDEEALRKAYETYERCKWEIISQKMLDYGVEEKWHSSAIARKWQELLAKEQQQPSTTMPAQAPQAASITPFSSPASTGATPQGGYTSMQ